MIPLLLALTVAAPGMVDPDLPRSLAEDESRFVIPEPAQAAKNDLGVWLGFHLGVASAYDSADSAFDFGFDARVKLLPWLGVEGSIDFQTTQAYSHHQIHVFQVPFEFAALFYVPLEGSFHPYGTAGVGWTITSISYSGTLGGHSDTDDLNALFFLGLGAEVELQPNVMLDANIRWVFASDPPHFNGNSADWVQFTVGILVKLSQ